MIAAFSSEFETGFYFCDEVVLYILILAALFYIHLDVLWNILWTDGAVASGVDNVDDVVLLPFLEIVVEMLVVFFSFGMHRFEGVDVEGCGVRVDVGDVGLVLRIERCFHFVELLADAVEEWDAFL